MPYGFSGAYSIRRLDINNSTTIQVLTTAVTIKKKKKNVRVYLIAAAALFIGATLPCRTLKVAQYRRYKVVRTHTHARRPFILIFRLLLPLLSEKLDCSSRPVNR